MPTPSRAALSLVVSRSRQELDDAELAQALIARKDWAVTEAWHRFAPMVLSLAQRTLGSKSDAEDVAQDVFTRVFGSIATLRDATSLRSFVYSVAIRTLKSHLRYRRLRSWLSFHGPEALVDLRHSTPDVENRDLLRNFYVLLDRLSPRDRLVFMFRRAESMTVDEIAQKMNIAPSTVKRSLAHATERLAHWVDANPGMAHLLDHSLAGRGE